MSVEKMIRAAVWGVNFLYNDSIRSGDLIELYTEDKSITEFLCTELNLDEIELNQCIKLGLKNI